MKGGELSQSIKYEQHTSWICLYFLPLDLDLLLLSLELELLELLELLRLRRFRSGERRLERDRLRGGLRRRPESLPPPRGGLLPRPPLGGLLPLSLYDGLPRGGDTLRGGGGAPRYARGGLRPRGGVRRLGGEGSFTTTLRYSTETLFPSI